MNDRRRTDLMSRALSLAARGAGRVAPNPMVGALVVKNDQIIGRGYHQCHGGPHAEVNALADCTSHGHDPRGATMLVTLEPCCHQGKTGPCTKAIARTGIAHVEIATLDEFELVAGGGAAWLKEHGITVSVGCCRRAARRLNTGFFNLHRLGRPQVILKWAQSLDAKLAYPPTAVGVDPSAAPPRWITNAKSRRHVHKIRSRCGAVMVGIGTVLADDPLLNARLARKTPQPLRVVLDSHLRIPLQSQLLRTAREHPVLICTLETELRRRSDKHKQLVTAGCEIFACAAEQDRVSLPAVLEGLGRRGVTDLLVEGGPTVHAALLEQSLADKVMAYIAPTIIGDRETLALSMPAPAPPLDRLEDTRIQRFDDDVLIEGYLTPLPD